MQGVAWIANPNEMIPNPLETAVFAAYGWIESPATMSDDLSLDLNLAREVV